MQPDLLQLPPATVVHGSVGQAAAISGLDLILPCWNPSGAWAESLIRHYREVIALMGPVPVQLILVNDGSLKNFTPLHTARLKMAIPGIIIVSYPQNRGKGYAVREGAKHACNAFQVYTDLDFPFGAAAIKQTYDQLQQGLDVVAGERGAAYLKELPRKRRMITRVSRQMNKVLLRLKVSDAQAGLKGFNTCGRSVLLHTRVNGFLCDSEFLYHAGRHPHIKIGVVAVFCRPGIHFTAFRPGLLLKELRNYLRIIMGANAA